MLCKDIGRKVCCLKAKLLYQYAYDNNRHSTVGDCYIGAVTSLQKSRPSLTVYTSVSTVLQAFRD